VEAEKIARVFTNEQKADLDHRTSNNKIGEVVNLSQELNTIIWHKVNNLSQVADINYNEILDVYHDVCILNICSMIEIDKAKSEFRVSVDDELKKIRTQRLEVNNSKTVKPAFLGFIASTKNFNNSISKDYKYHDTTMDYLIKALNKYRAVRQDSFSASFTECFKFDGFDNNVVNRRQLKNVIDLCYVKKSRVSYLYSKKQYFTSEEIRILLENYRENLFHSFSNMKISVHTIYKLLTVIDDEKHSFISKTLFELLFTRHNDIMISLMDNISPSRSYIDKDPCGEIVLYGINFMKNSL
jgi:hypothetical protein